MSRYKLLTGFRLTELILCGVLITLFMAWSLETYRAYIVNARMLEPYSQLQDARLNIAIDNAYTGSFLSAADYKHEPHAGVNQVKISPQGHLTAQFSLNDLPVYSQSDLNQKTLVLLLNSYNQGGYQFNSWRCPDNPSPKPFSTITPVADATVDPRYSYFICHGHFR